jgi:hypothetical protein
MAAQASHAAFAANEPDGICASGPSVTYQADVVPAVFGHAVGGDGEHLLGFVNADDGAGGADLAMQQRCTQPSAAADVEDGIPGPDGQRRDEQFTPLTEGVGAPVIVTGLAPVGLRRRQPFRECRGCTGAAHAVRA